MNKFEKCLADSLKEDADIFESLKEMYKLRHEDVEKFKEALRKRDYVGKVVEKYGLYVIYEPDYNTSWKNEPFNKEQLELANKFYYWREEQQKAAGRND